MKEMKFNKFYFIFLGLMILSLFLLQVTEAEAQNSCLECHRELEDGLRAPVEAFKNDIHQKFGLTCVSCHGGNEKEDDLESAKDSSFKGTPGRKQIPAFCGDCHQDSDYIRKYNPSLRIDQLGLYWTSQHGKLLKKGDIKVAVCIDCHGSHGILEASHPKSLVFPWNLPSMCGRCHSDKEYMREYSIPITQEKDYRESVHARALFEKKDLSAAVCNDCHGNHGAMPPGVSAIAFVCHQCHPSASELFSQSPHKEAFGEMGISECEACHENHRILPPRDEMLGTGEESVCLNCHEQGSKGFEVSSLYRNRIESFKNKIKKMEEILETAERKGVEVSESKFDLREAQNLLVMVRNLTHSLNVDDFEKKINEGEEILSSVQEKGEKALNEAKFRKRGLIIATIFIFLLATAIFLKIKKIEKKIER